MAGGYIQIYSTAGLSPAIKTRRRVFKNDLQLRGASLGSLVIGALPPSRSKVSTRRIIPGAYDSSQRQAARENSYQILCRPTGRPQPSRAR